MDKQQMTVTVSEPELLAYLRQFADARERSIMLRRLAIRGLQAGRSAGAEDLMLPPASRQPTHTNALRPPIADTRQVPPQHGQVAPAQAAPPQNVAQVPAAVVAESNAPQLDDTGLSDPLAGIDVAALNDAMARY
ncbi:hypothetical protein D9X30_1637 (plasmid) [Cupriavidus sp. U2]|uniref:hypothetical protein n=1 Tax=Cupriavidus sp. U2 TaxID=2920269 RepID=UPI00129EBCC2|nr:hypothetical protein [Cupriavidus sp. U2]KAI3593327.1 hypothetical protein D9X30_1637 [Cupriavidus sp. U2]